MATTPYSKLKGDPYRAYEELPAEVRRAMQESLVDWCPLRAREWHIHLLRQLRLRPAQAAHLLVQTIRRHDHAEVTAFATRFRQDFGFDLLFADDAVTALIDASLAADKTIRALCEEKFRDFQHGLKLVAHNTGRTQFPITREVVEDNVNPTLVPRKPRRERGEKSA